MNRSTHHHKNNDIITHIPASAETIRQRVERARSNAAGVHVPKPHKGTRSVKQRHAIQEFI